MTSMPEARANRDAAIARVEANVEPEWGDVAYRAFEYLASKRLYFRTDDVWDVIEQHYPGLTPHEPRAMGAVVKRAVREKVIAFAGCDYCGTTRVTVPGRRAHGNATDVALYVSLRETE